MRCSNQLLAVLLVCTAACGCAKKSTPKLPHELPTPGWSAPCSETLQSERTNAVFSCSALNFDAGEHACDSSYVRVFACDRGRPCRRRGLDWIASDHVADDRQKTAVQQVAPSCAGWCDDTCDNPDCTACPECAKASRAGEKQQGRERQSMSKSVEALPTDAADDVYLLCESCGMNCCRETKELLVCHSPAPPPPPPVPQPPPTPPPNPPPPRPPPPCSPPRPPPWKPARMPPTPPLLHSPPPPPPPSPPPRPPPGAPPAAPPTVTALVRQNLARLEGALPPKTRDLVRRWRYSSALLVALAAGAVVYIATRLFARVVCGRRHRRVLSSAVDDDDDDDDEDDEEEEEEVDVDVEEGKRGDGGDSHEPRSGGKATWSGKHINKSDATATSAGEERGRGGSGGDGGDGGDGTTAGGDAGSDALRSEEERAARAAVRAAFRQQVLERAHQKLAVASAVAR